MRVRFTLNVTDARAAAQQGSGIIRSQIVRALHEIGAEQVGKMKTESPRFSGHLANAHARVVDEEKLALVIFNRARHAPWLEEGTRHSKMPPPAALARWAARKLGDPRLAFVVARAILRRGGLRARRWMQRVFDEGAPKAGARLQAAVDAGVAEINHG